MGKNIIWLSVLGLFFSCSKPTISPASIERSVEIGFKQALEKRLTKDGITSYKIKVHHTAYQPDSDTVKIDYHVVYRKGESADIEFQAESVLKPKRNFWNEVSNWSVVETSEKNYAIGFLSPTEVIASENGR